ncbi:MAG: alpha/beta hydrolase family protein [Planctomycetota bacterium]|jgi:hypothetical protein
MKAKSFACLVVVIIVSMMIDIVAARQHPWSNHAPIQKLAPTSRPVDYHEVPDFDKHSISLAILFAPPSQHEIDIIKADWLSRNPMVQGWIVESEGILSSGHFAKVVSHEVSGYRHYGLIRYPGNFVPGGSYPVLVFNHMGCNGARIDELNQFDNSFLPGTFLADNFFYIMPSYRSEHLNAGELGYYQSEGDPSVMDWDVDDTLALLYGVLTHIDDADPARIAVYGGSRGGSVSLLVGIRDDNIKLLAELFAPTCWNLPSIRKICEDIVNNGGASPNNLIEMIMDIIVYPYMQGAMSLGEARLAWIRRSPVYFAEELPDLEFHHGKHDDVVSIEHSDRLDEVLYNLGPVAPYYKYFLYPYGYHNPHSLPNCGERVEAFLSNVY